MNVVVNWQNKNGDIHAEIPEPGTDYEIEFHTDTTNWFKGSDGYYYYKYPVPHINDTATPDVDETRTQGSLLTCTSYKTNGEYFVGVDIMAQCIQWADKSPQPVEQAWGVTVNADGSISK